MKKKLLYLLVVVVTMLTFSSRANQGGIVELANIEALAGESGTSHYWCCGNTNVCVKATNLTINGKLSSSPC